MNINLFKTFIRVVETQNLSRTADEFGLSQPAITKQIQALEDMYGVLLLERSGRRLKTTEAGEILYNCAREIVRAVEKTEKEMANLVDAHKGTLALGASNIPGEYILPKLIKDFKDNYPNIGITMDIADTEKILGKVSEREIDVGIVGGWINNRKIDGFKWLEDELVALLPANHKLASSDKVSLKDLAGERWIFREKGSGTRKATEDLLAARGIRKEDINVYMEAGSTEAVLASVESGMGIAVVSRWAIRKIDPHRKLKGLSISDPGASRYFYVVFPRQKTRRKSVENFLEFVQNYKF
ncbi:MAG: selenium metabolism-associated LysR family transcriptional regulator [Deltaproteobacteria bacterium]